MSDKSALECQVGVKCGGCTYFVLIDAPYADDGVSSRGEQAVQSRVQLQGVHAVPIVLLHFISDHVGNLKAHSIQ